MSLPETNLQDTPILELCQISKKYQHGSTIAAKEISFKLAPSEVLAILGPSGCGKTTLLRLIAGFERPDQGKIYIQGEQVAGKGIWVQPEKRKLGMVFQDFALFPHLNVIHNISFGINHLPSHTQHAIAHELLHIVALSGLDKRHPHELSGGQQQRVALARALAPNPSLVLLDEPFCNLDADMRCEMRREVHRILKQTQTAGLLVTHDQEEAFDVADRVGVLEKGYLHQLDTPEAVYHTPVTRFVADFVGQADFIPGELKNNTICTPIGVLSGPIYYPKDETISDNTHVEVMIRPDDINISVDPLGIGTITHRHFRGSETLYTIKLADDIIIHSSKSGMPNMVPGDKVSIKTDTTHLIIFPLKTK